MATYAIGDIQGCFDALKALLSYIRFNEKEDTLWFAGDLVNRGPKSLETLKFIKNLGDKHKVVLGNHDLHLLALAEGVRETKPHDKLLSILNAKEKENILTWLRHQPLLVHDDTLNYTMTHAGLLPQWDLALAKKCAYEAERALQSATYVDFLKNMFGNEPNQWHDDLAGWDRLRCIINGFTRLRFCTPTGVMDFTQTGPIGTQPEGCIPWYEVPERKNKNLNILFGHWASLEGKTSAENVFALDTGCVWGGPLRAMRLEDRAIFDFPC
ncbi:MAG: symmetrical bis(5'-nucleosyl)-tetraphosphatase [Gammaproteobacteria bacterium]